MKRFAIIALVALFFVPACSNSPKERSIEEEADLQMSVQNFHREMRWSRWESASVLVVPEERQAFLGRYEELGDDFRIVDLDVKAVDRDEESAVVDLEQQSYTEPDMTVKKERIVELWEMRDDRWMLAKRMLKDEFREKVKTGAIKREEQSEGESGK